MINIGVRNLSKKEKLFCRYYVSAQNVREAAVRSGFTVLPELKGIHMLSRKEIRDEIDKIRMQTQQLHKDVRTGLERIAFGGIGDAVRLILCDDASLAGELDSLDLFCVSEIKRPKSGGMEIKFFDRLKALEKLQTYETSRAEDDDSFYRAIRDGARLIYEDNENEHGV